MAFSIWAIWGQQLILEVSSARYTAYLRQQFIGTLVAMGIHLIDNSDYDAVSATCAKLGRSEFLFTMAPLILERGTASPVNPLAIF